VLGRLDVEVLISYLILWGVVDLIIGFVALYAGVSILRGGAFEATVGIVFATLGIIRWLLYVPVSPVLAVVVIVLDMLVVYWLAQNSYYFEDL
jgi:hypothetical protein